MTISYPLSLPAGLAFKATTFRARDTVAESRSPFTGERQVYVYPAQWWEVDITLRTMTRAQRAPWNAFLLSLKGKRGTFLLGDPLCATPRGSAASAPGTPLVKGGGQTGGALVIDGLPHSVSGYLKADDYVQLGSGSTTRLYKSLTDVDTNSSGEATIDLWPDLRSAPADNAAVTVSGCLGLFARASNDHQWVTDVNGYSSMMFTAYEPL